MESSVILIWKEMLTDSYYAQRQIHKYAPEIDENLPTLSSVSSCLCQGHHHLHSPSSPGSEIGKREDVRDIAIDLKMSGQCPVTAFCELLGQQWSRKFLSNFTLFSAINQSIKQNNINQVSSIPWRFLWEFWVSWEPKTPLAKPHFIGEPQAYPEDGSELIIGGKGLLPKWRTFGGMLPTGSGGRSMPRGKPEEGQCACIAL